MKKIPLSPELLRGVHHLEKTDQGVMLQRMPAGVMELYQDQPGRVIRAQCPAGVRIVFITDSTTVRLPHRFGGTSREIYAFDAFIDDAPAVFSAENGVFAMHLAPGKHKVEILVPHLVECFFDDLEIDGLADISPVEPIEGGKLLFVGDSIMQGMTTSSPAKTYADLVTREKNTDFYNLGIGGMTVDPRWAALIAGEYTYDRVIFSLGVNDFVSGKSLADYRKDLSGFLAYFAGKPMVIISITPFTSSPQTNPLGETVDQFRECVRELAAHRPDTVFIPGEAVLPENPQYLIDGLHPNDLGAEVFARNLSKALSRII